MLNKIYKRKYKAILYRNKGKNHSVVLSTRFFARLSTAIKRCDELILENAQPGDVVEIVHSDFEFLIATMKIKVSKGLFSGITWDFEEKFKMAFMPQDSK